jgi:AcrR family transcriptional regulator
MPKAPRTQKEIDLIKSNIVAVALELINSAGYEALSMRKLAARLGIAAKTIYNYYENKDELYLDIVIDGYRRLNALVTDAYNEGNSPVGRLEKMAAAYLDFGLENANFYNLMFTWHTPKYNDYVGTPSEGTARIELETSMQLYALFLEATLEAADEKIPNKHRNEQAQFYVIYYWSVMHGYISGYHNTLLGYMHPDPLALRKQILDMLIRGIRNELKRWQRQQKNK